MLPWAGYCRVSRVGDRAETLVSPDLQAARIAAYAEGRGLTVEMLPAELDVSGGKVERPILSEVLEGIEGGRYAGVIVAQLDRLSRMDIADALATIRRVESAGGQVIAVAENFDAATPEGRMARNMMLSLGEMQLDRYRLQFRAAKQQAVKRGIWPVPSPPPGYRRGPDRRLEADEKAPLIREAFRLRASGESWRVVADHLGVGMSHASKIVRNRAYLGELRLGEWSNLQAHEPLVGIAEFEAAQLKHPSPPRAGNPRALLGGLVRCAACGFSMTSSASAKRGYTERIYRCTAHNKRGESCRAPAIISTRKLDPYVEQLALAELESLRISAGERSAAVDAAEQALGQAEAELVAYQRATSVTGVGEELFVEGLRGRSVAVEEARRTLARARLAVGPLPETRGIRDLWADLSVEERGHVLRGSLSAVVVSKGRGSAGDRTRVVRAGFDLPAVLDGDLPGEIRPTGSQDIA